MFRDLSGATSIAKADLCRRRTSVFCIQMFGRDLPARFRLQTREAAVRAQPRCRADSAHRGIESYSEALMENGRETARAKSILRHGCVREYPEWKRNSNPLAG